MSSQRRQQTARTQFTNPSDNKKVTQVNQSTMMTESDESNEERKEHGSSQKGVSNRIQVVDISAAWPKKTEISQTKLMSKSISPIRDTRRLGDNSPQMHGAETSIKKGKNFNPEQFQFKQGDYNTKQEIFRQSFYEHGEANRHKINQQLVEMTYLAILRRFKQEKKNGDMPAGFLQNEMKWAGQLMRSKKLQKIMAQYNETVASVLDEEMKGNKELIGDFVKYPHRHSQSPRRNFTLLPDVDNPVWHPQKAPVSQKLVNVYNKQKQHLAQLANKNQQKKAAEVEIQSKMHQDVAQKFAITEQVLARMATRKTKQKDAKQDKPVMTPFCEAIHERLQLAKGKIDSMLETNDEFKEQIAEIEDDLTKSGIEKAGKNPGNAIKHLLAKWSEEPTYSQHDMANYRNELWMSLENFEKFLKEQEFAMAIELKNTKIQYRTRVDGIRAHTSMRIEVLESALIETKLRYKRERERAEMQLAEMESRTYNTYLNNNDDAINRVVKAQENVNNPEFAKLEDADKVNLLERMCKQLRSSVISLQQEKVGMKKRVTELEHEVNTNAEFNTKSQANARESNEKILYYQQTLFEMLEETGIMSLDETRNVLSEDKQLALKEIYELNKERVRQDQEMEKTYIVVDEKKKLQRLEKFVEEFHETILTVDFRSIFQVQQKVMLAKTATTQFLTQQFEKLGVIKDLTKIATGAEGDGLVKRISVQSVETPQSNPADSPSVPRQAGLNRQITRKMSKQQTVQSTFGEFHQHVFRVDGQQLNEIQRHFEDLSKPVNVEISQLIQLQDIEKQLIEEDDSSLQSDSEQSVKEKKKKRAPQNKPAGKFMDSSATENKVKRNDPEAKKARLDEMKKKQAKRQEETERREKKEARAQQKREEKTMRKEASNKRLGPSNKQKTTRVQQQARESNMSQIRGQQTERHEVSGLKTRQTSRASSNMNLSASSISQSRKSNHSARRQSHHTFKQVAAPIEIEKKNNGNGVNLASNPASNYRKQRNNGDLSKQSSINKSIKAVVVDKSEKKLREVKGGQRKEIKKQNTNMSVTFKPKDSIDQAEKFAAEGLASDDMNTEPLDRTAEVLEELENKVLLKYKAEIDEVVAAPEQTFKLKATQNEKIYTTFKEGAGRILSKQEYNKMHTIGNLPQMIEYLNETIENTLSARETVDENQNLELRKEESIDYERKIPLSDCIATNLDIEGNIKGFQIRSEIAKVLMWREGGDMTQIFKTIKNVNFMNRLLFEPEEFHLSTKAKNEVAKTDEMGMQTSPVEFKDEDPSAEPLIRNSPELQQLVSLLKNHSQNLIAKGNESKQRYQARMQQDQTIEELMEYKLPVHLDQDDQHDLTFINYLQNLFSQLEQKMVTELPKEDLQNLSVSNIVFFGSGSDSGNAGPSRPKLGVVEACIQTMPTMGNSNSRKKVSSKYLQTGPKHKESQTDDGLLNQYITGKGLNAQIKSATQQLDKSVTQELNKTIATLSQFVDNVKLQKFMSREENLNKKQNPILESHRKSMATQISSNSPFSMVDPNQSQAMSPFTPVEQLRSIRAVIDSDKLSIQDEIILMRQKREAHKMLQLRTADFSARRQKDTEKQKKTGILNISIPQKLPKLSNAINISSERNYSQSVTSKSGHMPLLQNNLTARAGNPFKQVHVEKKLMLNNDSVQSKMSSPSKGQHYQHVNRPRSSGRNPPGLTTKKLDFGFKSPQLNKEGTFSNMNESTYDSQSKGQQQFKATTSYQGRINKANLTLRESTNGGVRVSAKFNRRNRDLSNAEGPRPIIMMHSVESSESSDKLNSSAFQNMLIVKKGFNTQAHTKQRGKDSHVKNAVSVLSTPASPNTVFSTAVDQKGYGTGRNRQLISIEPLHEDGLEFGRKISTTMQKHVELDPYTYETKTQN